MKLGERRRRYSPRIRLLVRTRRLCWSCHKGWNSIHWTVSEGSVSDGRQSYGKTSGSWCW